MLRKYYHVVIVFAITALISFALVYLAINDNLERLPFPLPSAMQKPVAQLEISDSDGVAVSYNYLACGHTVLGSLPTGMDIEGLSITKVKDLLPREQGWVVNKDGDQISITKYQEGFCPEDENKTHLGAVGEFVAVFKGPVGVNSHIIEVTDIPVANLPIDWQEQVERGELDFQNVKKLKETLDSLDEYSLGEYF
ncbi:hypothetical protein MFMK1_003070 [Metallumcola ferriviriculae]|uniref:Bypass of forespore C C-terminal domain-containing protein n=1 Tax=Metallumcola ferriviriculae TaxID=3039180 RepID=A0AAU0USB7_9FIRM|nr:hypothetical protein MFMK1_003070 [Desulfitibacteraceae bacterium MK1]